MQLAISSGLPSAIEIHILEESLETMRVGEFGQRRGTRNLVWLLRGLILKPKNVATISYSLSSQSCDRVEKNAAPRQPHQFSLLLLALNRSEAKDSNHFYHEKSSPPESHQEVSHGT